VNFREAFLTIARKTKRLDTEVVSIDEALGRVCSKTIKASFPNPPFPNSRWDGFAIRAADVSKATNDHPVELRIEKDLIITAGSKDRRRIEPGWCCAIMSGAPLPEGADAVVKFEDVEIGEEVIQVKFPVSSGDGLWQPGSFWDIGETLVEQGERIHSYNIFKLAEAGIGTVEVFRKPKLAIFAVGDELIAPGMPLREASRYGGLQYFIRSIAGQPQRVAPTIGMHVSLEGIIPDSVEAIEQAFHRAFAHGVDIVITTGGTGKGVKDLIVSTWIKCDGEVFFQDISMIPGKSTAGGITANTPWIALPGGAMGALVCFVEACRAISLGWYGFRDAFVKSCKVLLGMDVERHKYMHRALWGQIENRNGSLIFLPKLANSATLEKVDGYIVIEPGDGVVSKGSLCEAVVFEH